MTLSSKSSVPCGAMISWLHRTQRIPNMNMEGRFFIALSHRASMKEIDESFARLGRIEGRAAWDDYTLPMFATTPRFDGTARVTGLEKIFDMRQQLDGTLGP